MLNLKIFTITLLISFSLLGLVKVKVYVQDMREEIEVMEKSKSKLSDEIQVLKAEWSNLNRPQRLEKLAGKYLKLENIKSKKVRSLNEKLYNQQLKLTKANAKGVAISDNGWRYKPREMVLKISRDR